MESIKSLILITLSSIMLCHTNVYGQNLWSLERCIEYAHENNLQIKQQNLVIEQAENSVKQSKLDFIPSVNASINHNMNWGKSVNINDLQITNQLTQNTSANISVSMPIIEGLSKINTLQSNKLQLQISVQDSEKLKNDISISITQAFLQILLSIEIEKCTANSCKSVEEQVNRTQKLVDAGSQPYSSLLDIKAQFANEKMQHIAAINSVKSNYLTLLQLLDIPENEDFTISKPDIDDLFQSFSYDNIDQIYNSALSLPQIKSAELSLEKSRYDYKIQKGSAYPSISFSAGYGSYYSDSREQAFFSQFDDNRNPSIGFNLSIPIFNGWKSNTSIRNARLNIERNELELQKSRQQLYKDITLAYNNASDAYEKYIAAKANMEAGEESFKYVEQKFNMGMLNGTDYIVARTNLTKSVSECYQAKFQYIFQLKILDFYKGIPIEL